MDPFTFGTATVTLMDLKLSRKNVLGRKVFFRLKFVNLDIWLHLFPGKHRDPFRELLYRICENIDVGLCCMAGDCSIDCLRFYRCGGELQNHGDSV